MVPCERTLGEPSTAAQATNLFEDGDLVRASHSVKAVRDEDQSTPSLPLCILGERFLAEDQETGSIRGETYDLLKQVVLGFSIQCT
jgi:hypothetical protein